MNISDPVFKSPPNLSSWIYIIGRNFTSQIWGLNPGGGIVVESLRRFSTNKIRCFFYPRVYSISDYKMDTHFKNNGNGDFVYQTFVVSKYSKHQRIRNYIFASLFLVVAGR